MDLSLTPESGQLGPEVIKMFMLNSAEHKILNGHKYKNTKMDGWMTCNFTSFLTVFQSYQDDVWMIMKGCVQWNSVYG